MVTTDVYLLCILFMANSRIILTHEGINADLRDIEEDDELQLLLQEIMIKSLDSYKCVVIMTDLTYSDIFQMSWFMRFGAAISFIMIQVEEYEDLLTPFNETEESLIQAKRAGCQLYIILLANGFQVTRLLQFGDRYRVLDTIAKFIILYDNRLFDKEFFYLWRRIINVIFIRGYSGKISSVGKKIPWFEISTVPFPLAITNILLPRRLDIWASSKFRKGTNLFRDKTSDLQNQTLTVAAYSHLPGTAKADATLSKTVRAKLSLRNNESANAFSGTEIEIVEIVAKAMNFRCELYEPENAEVELWGRKVGDDMYTGIIGEMVNTRADIALGDLYYTPYILDLMDLSVPYNTECLTFLTPESLTDNSWKTLILPFKPLMWAGVIICLILSGLVFYILANFHIHITKIKNDCNMKKKNTNPNAKHAHDKTKKVVTLSLYPDNEKLDANVKYTLLKRIYEPIRDENDPIGLYQFSEPVNSALYTYSMLLLVSLPKLPTGWSLRMLTGWYWIYCMLLVTAYRASMTAILAKPTPRVRIDTLQELVDSKLTYGGWGELNEEFFKSSDDPTIRMIAENFVIVNNSEEAVDHVAETSFAFYENRNFSPNKTQDAKSLLKQDRSLHIMTDCIINMPISIGFQKNSPIKPTVDKFIRKVLEAGLIKKWLDDVMQRVLNAEIQTDDDQDFKALMNMKKFSGALVALFIGYFVSAMALLVENIYFKFVVKRHPNYNKYSNAIHENKKSM